MKRILGLLVVLILISSCGEEPKKGMWIQSSQVNITDNESAGVQEVNRSYEVQCKYAIGSFSSQNSKGKRYFELELNTTNFSEAKLNNLKLTSFNIAYMFFKNLEGEKENYDAIHVVLVTKENSEDKIKFSIKDLKEKEYE